MDKKTLEAGGQIVVKEAPKASSSFVKDPQHYRNAKKELPEVLAHYFGNVSKACIKLDIDRRCFYNWYKSDPEFKAKLDSDEFKQECKRRAVDYFFSGLTQHAIDNPSSVFYFFNKPEIMNLLHMSPTQMKAQLPKLESYKDIDNALSLVIQWVGEGKLSEKEALLFRDLLESKRKTFETYELAKEVAELRKRMDEDGI